jgi:PEGA domain-containing protein
VRALALVLSLASSLASGAHAKEAPARVTVIVIGAEVARVERAMADTREIPVEVVVGRLPNLANLARDHAAPDFAARLSAARRDYVNGEFAGCIKSLETPVLDLLGEGRRELGARVAFWQIACRVGSGAQPDAWQLARQFAVLGLDIPADVAAAAPEVESLLARALREVAAEKRAALAVDASTSRARVSLDGRSVCVTPCTLDVAPGDHVIALDADGALPLTRVARVADGGASLKLETTPASPEIAAQQWSARYGGSSLLYSEPSTRLLAQAIAARRLVLVNVEGDRQLRLRGTLATDGTVRAQVERSCASANLDVESKHLLRELLVTGKVFEPAKPIYKRAVFWVPLLVAVSAAVIASSIAGTLGAPTRTKVSF